jgi:RNA recognition motif-containing protein
LQFEKGHCTLVTRSEQTASSILEDEFQVFEGRKITCERFIENTRDRQLHHLQANNRRIVIKNIPAEVNEEKLNEFFSTFGEVIYSYFFKPSISSGASLAGHRTQTASVQFKSETPAARLIEKKSVSFHGVPISLHKFDPQYKSHSRGSNLNSAFPKSESLLLPNPPPGRTLVAGPISREDSSVFSSKNTCLKPKVPQLIHNHSPSVFDVFIKPTSKSYHQEFKQYVQYHSHDNLRFNPIFHVLASSPSANNIN